MNTKVKFGNHIGKYIHQLRKDKEMGLDELASLTDLDVVYLDLIERDRKTISLETLLKISKPLNINLKYKKEYSLY